MTRRALHLVGWAAWTLAWSLEHDRRKREAILITPLSVPEDKEQIDWRLE